MNILTRLRRWYLFLGANKYLFSERRCLTCKNRSGPLCMIPRWIGDSKGAYGVTDIDILEAGVGCMLWKPSALYRRLRKKKHGYQALDDMRKRELGTATPEWMDGVVPSIPDRIKQ